MMTMPKFVFSLIVIEAAALVHDGRSFKYP